MAASVYDELLAELRRYAATAANFEALQRFAVERIDACLEHYNWTGFYMLDRADPAVLVLGAYRGAPTEHVRIPVSEGICGAAVSQGQTIVIDDVHADPRYLACSLETRSEIVAPIRVKGRVVGELDIDSHTAAAFTAADRSFLEECAAIAGQYLEKQVESRK
jgi:GAF domain-containing protein